METTSAHAHSVVPTRSFDELRVGDILRAPCLTLTPAHAAVFTTVVAEGHPIPRLAGDVLVSQLEVSCRFLASRVNPGDTLYPLLIVTALQPLGINGVVTTRATIHNQNRELVLSGQRKYLLRR
ncbi:hypothetical protein AB0E75_33950 [Streptomyces griseoviridis]|uniref:Uncharacterized protein n=3 Tax=Streptomyces TaxID=1883 RepID=A0A918LLD3_STRGD|nr:MULTISPECIES: dehydratase [Streptomyces]MDP9685105.1 acyl dehydratase [Streptomyces griseoviridis]GGS70224.1 hypothetical protein GCM10010238_68320 [Streptomyces niveoruber]GGT26711.1 hypothetical protein GCM10010240_68660 [Streptomyces griseoviridis]GGU70252.1 hypothetical protein GCM10010259_69910 [Streptomyces daghestanicus]GHI32004.1 hypothetical protein Sdagh_37340 [Streptomyces daghestanicus]